MEIKSQFEYAGKTAYVTYRDADSFDELEGKNVTQVYAICFWKDKVVLAFHGKNGNYTLVGGTIEKGETYEECLKREIKEESNMKIISFIPIGYQEVTDLENPAVFQLRYACVVEPYGDFVSDPAGSVTEIKLIDPEGFKEHIKWGEVGDRILDRALELKNAKLTIQKVQSFGIIPIFKDQNRYKILIVKNTKSGQWGLPKGTPEKGEVPVETAKRELFEETGIKDVKIESEPTFSENYSFEINGINYHKTNLYYICFVDQMIKGENLDEIDETKWVSFEESRNILTFDSVIGVVNELEQYLLNNNI